MADIDIQRKGPSIWPWLLGLLALLVVAIAAIWWIAADEPERELAYGPAGVARDAGAPGVQRGVGDATPAPTTQPAGDQQAATQQPATPGAAQDATGAIPITTVIAQPNNYIGRSAAGEVVVTRVVSDRGFYIEANGQQIFAVIDEPQGEVVDINPGQRLRMNARVLNADTAANIPGIQGLEQQTQQILRNRQPFLLVDATSLRILQTS